MVLDPTTREANVRDSVKKFFKDNLYTAESIKVSFDKSLASPKLQGQTTVVKWVSVNFGDLDINETLSTCELLVLPCTREDPEGYQLAHLNDKVRGYLEASGRITLYRSYENQEWEVLGAMMVFVGIISQQMTAKDGTKYRRIPVLLKWGSKYE
jgi:hypothetical protein